MNKRVYDWRVYPVLDVTRAVKRLVTGLTKLRCLSWVCGVGALHGSIFLFGGFT
jgi:hypothetical protein